MQPVMIRHYQVIKKLGSGGMGIVYKAFDTRLHRHVALKVLREDTARDPSARERFLREARLAARLSHPGICQVFDQFDWNGQLVIVMELLAGSSLVDYTRFRRITTETALDFALQVSAALCAAHKGGLIHRDITPRNIMVCRDRRIKLVDFGLAKNIRIRTLKPSESTETMEPPITQRGEIMGTLGYVAPEQIQQSVIDGRTDQFGLAVVTFEMITRKRAFGRGARRQVLEAILKRNPSWPPSICRNHPDVVRVINRALSKDPRGRFRSMAAFHQALERAAKKNTGEMSVPNHWKPVAIAACLAALLAWIFIGNHPKAHSASAVSVPVREQMLERQGQMSSLNLAQNGESLVFASRESGRSHIMKMVPGSSQPTDLSIGVDCDDAQPSLSPDGVVIAFRSECDHGGLFLMDVNGNGRHRISKVGYNPAWAPSGLEIAFGTEGIDEPLHRQTNRSAIYRLRVGADQPHLIHRGDAVQPTWSPHGVRVAYWSAEAGKRDIYTIGFNGSPVRVTDQRAVCWFPRWSPSGDHLYFLSDRSGKMAIWRVGISETTGIPIGAPELVLDAPNDVSAFSLSSAGKLAYLEQLGTTGIERRAITTLPSVTVLQNGVTLGRQLGPLRSPDVSADGSQIAVYTSDTEENIVILDAEGGASQALTNDKFRNRNPRYSPDGRRVAFYSNRSGMYQIHVINRDGTGLRQLTQDLRREALYPIWAPDSTRLAYSPVGRNTEIIDADKAWALQEPELLPSLPGEPECVFIAWSWSNDGGSILGFAQRSDGTSAGIWLYRFDNHAYENITDFGTTPRFVNDGRTIIFSSRGSLFSVPTVRGARPHEFLSVWPDQVKGGFSISADNSEIYFTRFSPRSILSIMVQVANGVF
jgi:serine/threonine protein kinase